MSVVLSEHLPLLASAPGGIQKLRGLILELAVRGRLVPQDPSDEPASELLKRIALSRAALNEASPRKRGKQVRAAEDNDWPFSIPDGWEWTSLSNLTRVLNGRAYSKEELLDAGTPVLRVGNLFTSNHWYYSDLELEPEKYCNKGDLIYSWSASFGPFIWNGPKVIYHYHIWKLSLFDETSYSKDFLYKFLLEKTAEIKAAGHGVSMVHMTKEKMEKLPVPVPPLAEQHRIVAKIDELMALCDQLEAEQGDATSAHARLVETLLGTLTQSTDAADLAANWQRLAEHFDTLFTTEASIDVLKQTVLQLAVMGKLVPQDPNDEPASALLKRIAHERARLEAKGACKKIKPLPCIEERAQPFQVPNGWEWVRWVEIAQKIVDIDHKMPDTVKDGVPYVSPRDFYPDNRIDFEGAKKVSRDDFLKLSAKIRPEVGDIIYPRYGTIGENRLVVDDLEFLASYSCCVIKTLKNFVDPNYQFYFSISQCCRDQAKAAENKTTQANVGIKSIQEFAFPLPPLREQQQIVAKIDELMALCDRLKADLTSARQQQATLADTLIDAALEAA
ncbi:MAG: restriction endonuclease subunit S [Zoogloea sp.]|nr:restriction endonuclease subunit S [Zoogloea sp.]